MLLTNDLDILKMYCISACWLRVLLTGVGAISSRVLVHLKSS